MINILLIEDNLDIADNIKKLLNYYDNNFFIDIAKNRKQALEKFFNNKYHLILLDIMLPDGDGFDILKIFKKEKSYIPVIIISALGDDDDKIKGLSLGADDYLPKPFKVKELFLRIKNLLNKTNFNYNIEVNNIRIDLYNKKVFKDNEEIHLKTKEFLILENLIKYKTLSRQEISDIIRGDNNINNDNKIDVYISNLRKKLGKDIITTIKGYGYRININ